MSDSRDTIKGTHLQAGKMRFEQKVELRSNYYSEFWLKYAQFNDTVFLTFNSDAIRYTKINNLSYLRNTYPYLFYRCRFDKVIAVYKNEDDYGEPVPPNQIYNPLFQTSNQNETDDAARKPLMGISFKGSIFNGGIVLRTDYLKAVSFEQCTFNCPVFLRSTTIENCNFNLALFSTLLDLRNCNVDSQAFQKSYFKQNCNVLLGPADEISKLGISCNSLDKIFFVIDWGWPYSTSQYVYWNDISSKFEFYSGGMLTDCDSIFSTLTQPQMDIVRNRFSMLTQFAGCQLADDDLLGSNKQRALNWLNYQLCQYEKLYYKVNHNWPAYLWYRCVELTVNFGYKGESRFFFITLMLVLFFTFLYRIKYHEEVDIYYKLNSRTETRSVQQEQAVLFNWSVGFLARIKTFLRS